MLKLDHIQKHYEDFSLDCSFELRPGYITGLIGQNGAGKSTAFKSALGLVHLDGGTLSWFGKEMASPDPDVKRQIGIALSDTGFSEYLSIKDIIPILASFYPTFHQTDFLEKCRRFHLPMDKKIQTFSTGMKAKFKVIAALSHDSRILLLDEPTAGLDVIAREEILNLLREYMEQDDSRSILISSHISADLEGLCDDIYMIHNGKVIFHEDTDVLLGSYAVLKMEEEQYHSLDKQYILRSRKEPFGYCCLTNQKQYYLDNYPKVVIENGSIDDTILLMMVVSSDL